MPAPSGATGNRAQDWPTVVVFPIAVNPARDTGRRGAVA